MSLRLSSWIALCLALSCALVAARSRATNAPAYRVIVHPQNPLQEIPRAMLADAFLKKVTRWPDGQAIRPVDQPSSSNVRKSFTDDVLRRSVGAVKSYWQQLIFSGRDIPPPELESDAAVRDYVLRNRGAVGYVSGATELQAAKAIGVR